MKKQTLKGISLLVIAVLLISQVGATQPLTAEEMAPAEETTELGVPYSEIPLELTPQMLDERNHVRRVRDEEVQENMAVFENADGTRTAYLFSEDIWYEDEAGEKQDYGKELVAAAESGIAYRTVSGSGELHLPATLSADTPIAYEQNGLKITMAPTLDRVVSVPLPPAPGAEAAAGKDDPMTAEDGQTENSENKMEQDAMVETSVQEAANAETPLQTNEIAGAPESESGMETSSETAAEPAGQNESTAEATGYAALQGEASNGTDAEEAVDGALDEDELLAEIPVAAEPVYSHLADNTIVQVDASRNLLEQVGDQLLGARRASLQETVSADSGRTAELVSYSRAFIDAAVEYKCVPLLHGFKNEIVLNSENNANTYSFITDFDGLTPQDSTGYSIPLTDETGEVVSYLALEELRDASGNYSMENVIDIAQYADGRYLVTITLDEAFLDDEDTVYPVTAAASSTGWLYHTSMDDTHIMQSVPTTNYYSATVMYMGRWASYPARIMMQFVFTDALKSAIAPERITEAKLFLWDQSSDTTRRTVNVRIPTNIWTASTVTWNTAPSYNTGTWNGIPAPTSHTISGDPGWWAFPYMKDVVAAMLRNYIDTSLSQTIHEKRGIMIKLADETVGLKTFRSSNHSENRPNMSITYTPSSTSPSTDNYWNINSGHPDVERINCWGYSLHMVIFNKPTAYYGGGNGDVPISDARQFIKEHTPSRYYLRDCNSYNSTLYEGEHMISVRINSFVPRNSGAGTDSIIDTYHFVVKLNNGTWAHKMGSYPSERISLNGNTIANAVHCWDEVHPTNYYQFYFAVSPSDY